MPTETGKGGSTRPNPPTHEELAAAFPQLEILELIGQGGMGFVFKARQKKIDRVVALKILPQTLAVDPAFAERFTREGRVLARLSHPNIVMIHDFGQANGFFYLLMEFVDGVNLREAMKVGRFTTEQALAVVPKICEALQFAHDEGILHRDIKPENILLDSKGRIKIADFGIAKLMGDPHGETNLTVGGATLGTPHYMAPEQLETPGKVDHRADIYSLGVVFYEMLTGELPIGKFQPPSRKVKMDVRLDDVVLQALEKEPERRYQKVSEVKTEVDTITSTAKSAEKTQVLAATAPVPVPKDRFWRRFAIVVALFLLALILIPVVAMLLATVLPAFNRAHRQNQKPVVHAAGEMKLMGIVIDGETGKPIGGARIIDQLFEDRNAAKIQNETTTGTNGQFELLLPGMPVAAAHFIRVTAVGYEQEEKVVPEGFANKAGKPFNFQLVPTPFGRVLSRTALAHALPSAPSSESRFVLDTVPPQQGETVRSNRVEWHFKGLIPPNQLAQVLFVRWTNGVPSIDKGGSGYFKVGAKPADVEFFLSYEKHNVPPPGWAAQWNVSLGLGFTTGWPVAVEPPFTRVTTPYRMSIPSGHQASVGLLDFVRPSGVENRGPSGIELRIILEPLKTAPIRTFPNEKDMGDFIGASGMIGTVDEALEALRKTPAEPGTFVMGTSSVGPPITLLAVEDHSALGMAMWKPDGSMLDESVRAALTNDWSRTTIPTASGNRSSKGVWWFSFLISNAPEDSILAASQIKIGRQFFPSTPRIEKSPLLGGTLCRVPSTSLDSRTVPKSLSKVRFGVPVRSPRTLLAWEGQPLKLVENKVMAGVEPSIDVDEFAAKEIRDYEPLKGFSVKTNDGSSIQIKLPTHVDLVGTLMIEVIDEKGREHISHYYVPAPYAAGECFSWDIDVVPSDIRSVKLRGYTESDYHWAEFEKVALQPNDANTKTNASN